MIDHSTCDHPSTRSARAKCRRDRDKGLPTVTLKGPYHEDCDHDSCVALRPKTRKAKDAELGTLGKAQTPGFRSDECHVCGVERIEFKGTDVWTGLLVLVGERCAWRVKRSDNFQALP